MPRAILSVYDKTDLVDLAQALDKLGWQLIASGGTAAVLSKAGLNVTEVAEITGFPELLGGRVKTLHPAVHAGILATGSPAHTAELASHGLSPIDLVICNLYPFERTISSQGVTLEEATEQIDIGGVTLLRAAAKNFSRVIVLCDPADYAPFLAELQIEPISIATRRRLAYKAIASTAAYDASIRDYFDGLGFSGGTASWAEEAGEFPSGLHVDLKLVQPLRYGENPHQRAALYNLPGLDGPLGGQLLHGKPLSYNNILDLDAAWRTVGGFDKPAIAIIKHTNPCGLATAATLADAYPRALSGDPQAAFGGVLAANRPVDDATVSQIGSLFLECIVAPGFEPSALERLKRRTNLRLLQIGQEELGGAPAGAPGSELPQNRHVEFRTVQGGILAQQSDWEPDDESGWKVVSQRQPAEAEWQDLHFAWEAVRHLKSNAIAIVKDEALIGAGAGQMSRVDAVHMAAYKAGQRARGAVLGSDAFFPFADGVELAAEAGVVALIQPGGSVRDEEVITAADRLGLAMVFTGTRHFRH